MQIMGLEPIHSTWKEAHLPLMYTRDPETESNHRNIGHEPNGTPVHPRIETTYYRT